MNCLDADHDDDSLLDRAFKLVPFLSNSSELQSYNETHFAITYYVAGYAAHIILKRMKDSCTSCAAQFSNASEENLNVEFEFDCDPILAAEFTKNIDRGGLCQPSSTVFFLCNLCVNTFVTISNSKLMNKLVEDQNPRQLFVEVISTTLLSLDDSSAFIHHNCKNGHDLSRYSKALITIFFNCLSKNYIKEINIQSTKMPKKMQATSASSSKIKKLSGGKCNF